jgi:endonuclease YncB( thermonuclease family)
MWWPVLFLALVPAAWAQTVTGKVVRVADGDTLTILDAGKRQHRIRLVDIDAPERGQPFGKPPGSRSRTSAPAR